MKNTSEWVRAGMAKLIQMLPWITRISSRGIPTDLKVKSRTVRTMRMETMLTTTLSRVKEFLNSYWLVELPTTYTSPSG